MIPVLRRLLIITILFAIILFIQSIQVETTAIINPKTLAVLGFLILASFTLGEILAIIKLPRVIGYLLIGLFFGPYSHLIFQSNFLQVFNLNIIKDLSLVNTITLSIIALTAGMELRLDDLKKSVKAISLILLFKTVFIFFLVTVSVYFLSPFIPFLANGSWEMILAAGLLLSVIALGTSIELTLVVASESKAKGRFIDLLLSTAIVKDVLVILLLAVCLTISISLLNPASTFEVQVFTALGLELLLSVLVGALFGGLIILYLKYIRKELLLFIFIFVVVGSAVSTTLHLETLIVFITTGFVVQNFSKFGEDVHHPLNKLSLPIFITFFTVAGAAINLEAFQATFVIGMVIVIIRAIALYFSVNIASKLSKEPKDFLNYGWMGFLSIGGLMLGLGILIEEKIPGFGTELKSLITSVVAINLFLGPILLKIALGKAKKIAGESLPEEAPGSDQIIKSSVSEKTIAKFQQPDFEDAALNKSLFHILLKLDETIRNFEKRFIYQRSEESLELIISITEKYTDDYITLKQTILQEKASLEEMRMGVLEVKKQLDVWYLDLCEERAETEKGILKLESLVKELFISLSDQTDALMKEVIVDLEKKFYEASDEDGFREKLNKSGYRVQLFVNRIFNKEYKLKRKIDYRNIAKYHLVGESSGEILEAVNLVGAERLTTLRKIRNLFNDYSKYLDEIVKLTVIEEHNPELIKSVINKVDELHQLFVNEINIYRTEISNTTEEISSRLTYALASPYNRLLESLLVAGTYKFRKKEFKYSKIFAKSELNKDLALDTIRYWVNYYIGFLGLFKKEIYINRLNIEINQIVNSSLISLSEEISINFRQACGEINKKIVFFKNEVDKTSGSGLEDIIKLLVETKNDLLNNTIDKFIKSLEQIRKGKKLNRLIENLIHNFSQISHNLPEKILLLEDKDLSLVNRSPEFVDLKTVQLREVSKSFLEKRLPRSMGEINELLLNHLNLTLVELRNLFSMLKYHFETAENEVRINSTNLHQFVAEFADALLKKINFRVTELNTQIDLLEESIDKKILEKVDDNISGINKVVLEGSSLAANLFLTTENKKSIFFGTVKKGSAKLSYALRKFSVIVKRNYHKYFRREVQGILLQLHLIEPPKKKWSISPLFLKEERLKKLPFIYRKLFDGSLLESDDFLIQDGSLNSQMSEVLTNFRESKNSATVLIGEPGSGKSTFLNSIKTKLLSEEKYYTHNFTNTVTTSNELINILSTLLEYTTVPSLEELIFSLNDPSNKRIIILEGLEKLYLRCVGGYEAIKTFVYLVAATSKNTLWLCSSGKYAWNIFSSNFGIDNLFLNCIMVDELQKNSVKLIIQNRHNATGYGLKFLPDEMQQLKNKIFGRKNPKADQVELAENFYDRLEEYSEGNISSAMFYWLHSVREVQDNVLLIEPPRKIHAEYLRELNDFHLLSVAEILNHGWLTDLEHSKIFNIPLTVSHRVLVYLESLFIIYHDKYEMNSNKYFINKFIYRLIKLELKKRNMV